MKTNKASLVMGSGLALLSSRPPGLEDQQSEFDGKDLQQIARVHTELHGFTPKPKDSHRIEGFKTNSKDSQQIVLVLQRIASATYPQEEQYNEHTITSP